MHSVPLRWWINCCNSTCRSLKEKRQGRVKLWSVLMGVTNLLFNICFLSVEVTQTSQGKRWYVEKSCKSTQGYTTPFLGSVVPVMIWPEGSASHLRLLLVGGRIRTNFVWLEVLLFGGSSSVLDRNHWWRHYPGLQVRLAWWIMQTSAGWTPPLFS